jgi:polysaccharide biosynthesis transport protein
MTKEKVVLVEAAGGRVPLLQELRALPCPQPWETPEAVREHFRKAHASLRRGQRTALAVAICSLNPGEGVSYIAAKLACAAAEVESSVYLLDANRRRPGQENVFGLDPAEGSGLVPMEIPNMTVCRTSRPNLSVVFPRESVTGDHRSPAGLLGGLTSMRSQVGMTLVDCEALRGSSQVMQLAPALDGVLFVVQAERERREAIADAIAQLKRAEIPVLGLIVNKQRRYLPALLYRAL